MNPIVNYQRHAPKGCAACFPTYLLKKWFSAGSHDPASPFGALGAWD
jgi:hypothetical protein